MKWRGTSRRDTYGRLIMWIGHRLTCLVEWHELRCDAYGERSRLSETTNKIWLHGLRKRDYFNQPF